MTSPYRAAGAREAELLFKTAAAPRLGMMATAGRSVGQAMDTFGGALSKGYGALGKGFDLGSRRASVAGAGTAGKLFGGVTGALQRGGQAFGRAGGVRPALQGAGMAAGGYAAYKGLQHAMTPSQPQYQYQGM